jgi:cytochrome P450
MAQLDKNIWGEDADKFNPYRFDPTVNENLSSCIGQGAFSSYLPFGAGRHRCIGESFAYVQLKTIISTIIRNFDISFQGSQKFPKTDFTTLIVMPVKPVMVTYEKRESLDSPAR